MPSTGRRPGRQSFENSFKDAAIAADLRMGGFLPTPHILRLSGATGLLDAGRLLPEVARIGRWGDYDTLYRNCYRP